MNAKFCPLIPELISASRIDEGPTKGTTSIWKSCVYATIFEPGSAIQGKPASEDNIFHMKRELGDIMWYWTTACASLGLDPYEVISENQKKLEARYGEKFEVDRSEVRKDGDL